MARFALVVVFIMFAMINVAGICGSSGSTSEPTPVSDEAFLFMAQAAVNGAQLTLEDLPAGWSTEPPDDLDVGAEYFSAECGLLSQDDWLTGVAEAETDDFKRDEDTIASGATAYRNVNAADVAFAEFESVWSRCRGEIPSAITQSLIKSFEAEGVTVADVSASVDQVDPGDEGDWGARIIMEFTYEGSRYSYVTDKIIIREGQLVGSVTYQAAESMDESMRDALVKLVAARLVDADSTLPE
jgi:hypothetical protein